jgi:signal transduction histidine kinase/DNA-binding response OmpR family regulator
MKTIVLVLAFIGPWVLPAQSVTDSLRNELNYISTDSAEARIYRLLGNEYSRINLDSALAYFIASEQLAKKNELELDLAYSIYGKATVYRAMNLYEESLEELQRASGIFSRLNFTDGLVNVKIKQAQVAAYQNDPVRAVNLYLGAVPLAREVGNKNAEAMVYNNLANVFADQKQYHKAIEYYESALGIVTDLDFKPGISACLANLGDTYSILKQYDKAIVYLEKARTLKEQTGDKLGASRVLCSLGQIFLDQKDFEQASNAYDLSYRLAREVGDVQEAAKAQHGLAMNAFEQGNFKKCIMLAAEVISSLKTARDMELLADAHFLIARAYQEEDELASALVHTNIYNALSDSLYTKSIISITNELEAKFQNDQKAQEIRLLSSERELQALQMQKRVIERNVLVALALVILLIAVLLYNQYRIKQKANGKLQEMNRVQANFFANISHEFRTPLTLIKGPVDDLAQNPEKSLSADNIGMIRRNTNRVLKLVNQLLELSKLDEGNMALQMEEGDVFKCLQMAASAFSSHATQHRIDFRIEIPETALWVAFDRDKLEKITYNLLGNAFKFSDDGATVILTAGYIGQCLVLEVEDSGIGIAKEKLHFIFDRFYQAGDNHAGEKEGTGIGLSLSRELVELMGGTITVKSKRGRGSTFTVHLPLQQIQTRTAEHNLHLSSAESPGPVLAGDKKSPVDRRNLPNVLLVEDNPDMRQFIREKLLHSFKVREAVNGIAGLEAASADPPDLVVTDLMMPQMDGLEFCRRLKGNIHSSHIPVIMLTAKAGQANKLQGLETGADDYLSKPFDTKELLVRATNLIGQRRRLREKYSTQKLPLDPAEIAVTSVDQKFIKEMLGLLELHYAEPDFGVPQLQKALAMSRAQFHRKVKALTNETPGTLLRHFRLKRAAQLLAQNADSVTQIAYSVGFNNLSYFTKCFKELYGITPSEYDFNVHTA